MIACTIVRAVILSARYTTVSQLVETMTAYDHDWRIIRLTVLERDAHQCKLNLQGCTHHADAVDHIVPLSEGGRRLDVDNLRAACTACNSRRNRLRQAELAHYALETPRATGDHTEPSRAW